jgi:TonB family protein
MKIKITLTLLCLLCSIITYAQTAQQLAGKWKYEDVYNKKGIDSIGLKMVVAFFGDMTITFKENGHFKAFLMGKSDEGTWTLEGKNITMTSNKGDISTMEIIDFNQDKLVAKLATAIFIMARTALTAEDEAEAVVKEIETVSATAEQVSKKWFIKRKELPGKTEKQLVLINELVQGGYFQFSKNKKYEIQILNIKVNGKWEFGEGNTSIIVQEEDMKTIWNIQKISETELVLLKGNTEEKLIFSTNEPDAVTEVIMEYPPAPVVDSITPLIIAEEMPKYPGGDMALMKFVNSNISYPAIAKDNDIQGTVFISFIVEKDGSTSGHKVKRSVYQPIDEEALRVAKLIRFEKPGREQGKPVRVEFRLPIKFKLE